MLWGVGLFLKYPFSPSLLLFSSEVSFMILLFFLTRQQLPILMIVRREDNYIRKKIMKIPNCGKMYGISLRIYYEKNVMNVFQIVKM